MVLLRPAFCLLSNKVTVQEAFLRLIRSHHSPRIIIIICYSEPSLLGDSYHQPASGEFIFDLKITKHFNYIGTNRKTFESVGVELGLVQDLNQHIILSGLKGRNHF